MRDHEKLLDAVNSGVAALELPSADAGRDLPVLFVTGVPRSGTTLAYQVLCASGVFGFATNLIARFYRNPAFGAAVEELLRPLLG